MNNQKSRVWITGYGIVSSLGIGVWENHQSLVSGHHGIAPLRYTQSKHNGTLLAGEVKRNNRELEELGVPPMRETANTRTTLLALIAAREALSFAALDEQSIQQAVLFSATTVGGMDTSEKHVTTLLSNPSRDSALPFLSHDCADNSNQLARVLGIQGHRTNCSTACSSSANALLMGARLIEAGLADVVIAGGTDALSAFTINGFNALLLLSPELCQPFDENRKGLNLGEGAAYLVLESEAHCRSRGHQPIAAMTGWGNSCDAFHQTASSPEGKGAFLAMKKALDHAGLKPEDIQYINAHGTATPNNDLSESVALRQLFGKSIPPFSSTKSFTGHTLAASGSIEALFCCLAIQHQELYPNLHFVRPIPETQLNPITSFAAGQTIQHTLSNSFGFGGNCSSLVFSKITY